MRCVIYARFSSELQRVESIDSQLRLCREHAIKHGYTIVAEFSDHAQTGTNDKRDQFQRMIETILSGQLECDIVLVWKFDRLWRDKDAPGYYKYLLRQRNVIVESVSLQLDRSNPYSVFLESLDHAQAATYAVNLAIETTRGQTQNALACRSAGGRPALGYRLNERYEYEIDPRGAEIIRLIFSWYAAGRSYREIIAECQARGYRTAAGRVFGDNSLHELLHNEKYIGVFEYRAWKKENARKRSTGHMYTADEQVIRVEGGVPAIINRATWDAVQERLAQNRRKHVGKKFTGKAVYLLSGLIYCGICGTTVRGTSRTRRVKNGEMMKYHYYICSKKEREGCQLQGVRKEWLEEMVMQTLTERLFSPEGTDAIIQHLAQWRTDYMATREDTRGDTKKQLVKIERELHNLVEAIARGVPATGMMAEKMDALERERAGLAAQLTLATALDTEPDEGALRALLARVQQRFQEGDERARQAIIGNFVEAVVVYPEHVDVMLTLNPSTGSADAGSITKCNTPLRSSERRGRENGARDWTPATRPQSEGFRWSVTVSIPRYTERYAPIR
jgi:site-specific DNA recombinase